MQPLRGETILSNFDLVPGLLRGLMLDRGAVEDPLVSNSACAGSFCKDGFIRNTLHLR